MSEKMEQIQKLIENELIKAREKFPKPITSPHEGFAILLEEIEELGDEIDLINVLKDVLWKNVKSDNFSQQKIQLDEMRNVVLKIIKEAIQVGAMIDKFDQDFSNNILK